MHAIVLILLYYVNTCTFAYKTIQYAGTHDIQNISVTSPLPGQVRVTGDLIHGSNASGALVIAYSARNIYYLFSPYPNKYLVTATLSDLTSDQYQVSVFIVEKNGLPFNRSAAVPKNVSVNRESKPESDLHAHVHLYIMYILYYRHQQTRTFNKI